MKTLWIITLWGLSLIPASVNNSPKTPSVSQQALPSSPARATIQVAVLLDTSNSMDGLIDQAKAQLWEVVNDLAKARCEGEAPKLQIALYEYGNDNLNMREGYIRQVLSFSHDLDAVSQKLFGLTTRGGSEHCGQVIQTSLDQLSWNTDEKALNLIFIAGNEPFTQGPVNYRTAIARARDKDIVVNTIFCGNYTEGVNTHWKNGAQYGQGEYMAIDSDQRTVHIPSPFDEAILAKNEALNATYIAYGNEGESRQREQHAQDANAASYGAANAVKRAVSKSTHFYKSASWDLVEAAQEDDFELEEVVVETLSPELQKLSPEALKKHLNEQRAKRKKLQQEIAALNKKREAYVAKITNEEDNPLRTAMLKAIHKQGALKGYVW
ncbi:vWA domain-containing protein [Croceiramulus getboli]|nr:VWA domain-containing protein [Flavobacteriaceae bacterium YJPT1-3]